MAGSPSLDLGCGSSCVHEAIDDLGDRYSEHLGGEDQAVVRFVSNFDLLHGVLANGTE
ncbi:hypothetical protein [Micromonospora sp. RTP1Z1]|uniref:hypothetical protein n=1 Tax=Micromonospora sp. RTP1Z1 TaxID=2994043 RepID=UPI0029C7B130|nr:hypothetical protein [Micromonospora sp. RTP1Z1]